MTDYKIFAEELKKIIAPALEEEGIQLVELNFAMASGNSLLRLLVERACGGINLDDCARLNKKIGSILETSDLIREHYLLEVSSPGLDRPLKTKDDFLRCLKRSAKFFLNAQINGKIELEGRIAGVTEKAVIVNTDKGDLSVSLDKIIKAKQTI